MSLDDGSARDVGWVGSEVVASRDLGEQLGAVNAGDASAQPISARAVGVETVFLLGRFAPAAVQRDYQWDDRECELLLDDLERAQRRPSALEVETEIETEAPSGADAEGTEPEEDEEALDADLTPAASDAPDLASFDYYLGAIVLRLREPQDAHAPIFEVFDGLQRLCTLTVLMAVLRDRLRLENGEHDARASRLQALIALPDGGPRLTLVGRDKTLPSEIQLPGEAMKRRRGVAQSDLGVRLRSAAAVFRRRLRDKETGEIEAFVDFLLARVHLVLVLCDRPTLARQIFVTTNLRGLPLDRASLFKGQLTDLAPDEATADAIVRHWAGLQLKLGDALDRFLVAFDFIERRQAQGADCLSELADFVADRHGPEGVLAWTGRLTNFADAWADLLARQARPGDSPLDADLWRLTLFRWPEWRPLALLWWADFLKKGGPDSARPSALAQTRRRFDALHRRCMAITLNGYSERDRTVIFARAIRQTAARRNPLSAKGGALSFQPRAVERMRQTLRRPMLDKGARLTLLRWLEAQRWGAQPPDHLMRTNVEHILPQRPASDSLWLKKFPEEKRRDDLCQSLGNLALLDPETNSAAENADFAEKREIFRAAPRAFRTLDEALAAEDWTPEVVESTTQARIAEVFEDLALPEWE